MKFINVFIIILCITIWFAPSQPSYSESDGITVGYLADVGIMTLAFSSFAWVMTHFFLDFDKNRDDANMD